MPGWFYDKGGKGATPFTPWSLKPKPKKTISQTTLKRAISKRTSSKKVSGSRTASNSSPMPTLSSTPVVTSSQPVPPTQQSPNQAQNGNMSDLDYAMSLINAQYGGQESALNRGLATQREYQQTGDNRLANIYSVLNQQLEGLSGRTKDLFAGSQDQMSQMFQQSADRQKQAGQQAVDAVSELAKRLGAQDALVDPVSQLQQLITQQTGQLESGRTGALANLQTLGTGMQGTALQAISDAAREGAQQRTDFQTGVGADISDLLAQLQELGTTKGNALRTTIQDVRNERLDRERQAKLDALAEEIQRGTLDIQRQNLGLDREKFSASLMESMMGGNPLDDAKTQAEIDKIMSEIALNQSKLGQGAEPTRYKGQMGLEEWMNQPNPGWGYKNSTGGQSAGPVYRNGIYSLYNQALQQSAATGVPAYNLAIDAASKNAQQLGLDPQMLITGINILFGKY